ncbi:hypothetical protein ACQKIC_02625 [Peribacillus sp. NPDC046944]|uniref:hypothetical protein n=1 Tax=Peribacillus sp. NPDC046944 TaxID=3390607 RepID=UPI003D059074
MMVDYVPKNKDFQNADKESGRSKIRDSDTYGGYGGILSEWGRNSRKTLFL